MKKQIINKKHYEVNPHTMLILPHKIGGVIHSEIIEVNAHYTCNCTPFELIKTSCKFFGSSYQGRKDGTRYLINITHKPPIIIDPISYICAFPTASPNNQNCVWVFPQHIKEYKEVPINQTSIQFSNLRTIVLDISASSFNNQMARTSMLHMKFSQKMRQMEAEFPYINMLFPPDNIAAEPRRYYSPNSLNSVIDFERFSQNEQDKQNNK